MKNRILSLFFVLFIPAIVWARDYTSDSSCKVAVLFKEGSGTTVADSSGHGNTGNFLSLGHPAWTSTVPNFSKYGKAANSASYVAISDYINLGTGASITNLPAITIVAWVYATGDGGSSYGTIADKDWDTQGWGFKFDGTGNHYLRMFVSWNGEANYVIRVSSTSLGLNGWHFVVATYDGTANGSGIHLYIDNVESSYSYTSNGSGSRDDDSGSPCVLGNAGESSDTSGWAGYITNFALFNRVLKSSELLDIYNNGLTGNGSFFLSKTFIKLRGKAGNVAH